MDAETLLGELRKPETLTILGSALEPHYCGDWAVNEWFIAISKSYEDQIQDNEIARFQGNGIYAYAHSMSTFSASWAGLNPWFLA